ncbi:hypothetical protein J6590_091673 [Homalodisca vitripennis]|nr:hypothetical protein J6590_091673 [Homalodisca vitripennis]
MAVLRSILINSILERRFMGAGTGIFDLKFAVSLPVAPLLRVSSTQLNPMSGRHGLAEQGWGFS